MTDSTGSGEGGDTPSDPLASTQFFDTTSEFQDEDAPSSPDPTTVHEPEPTTVEAIPAAPIPPPPPPPPPLASTVAVPAVGPEGSSGGDHTHSRLPLVLSLVGAGLLVVIGVLAFVVITNDDGDGDVAADAPAVATTVAEPADDGEAQPGDAAFDPDAAGQDEPAADPETAAAEADAAEAFDSFVQTRGTDDEVAFSSEQGRAELDAIVDDLGDIDLEGDPECTAQSDDTVECVQDTDKGAITFTMGTDPDDPAGFEMIGAELG